MIDLRRGSGSPAGPGTRPEDAAFVPTFRELRLSPQPMTPVWRWFYSHKYPPLSPVPHSSGFGQCVIAGLDPTALRKVSTEALREPPISPRTPTADLVCYHNALVALGRADDAARFRQGLRALLPPPIGAAAGATWRENGQILGLRTLTPPGRPPRAEIWLHLDASPSPQSRSYLVEPVTADGHQVAPLRGELFSGQGAQPWLWSPRPGYLLVDTVPLSSGRQRIVLSSQAAPPAGSSESPPRSELSLGELELP
jgi:hypothetical protein